MPPHTFATTRLLLRPVDIVDVDVILVSYAQDEEVTRYLIWRPHRSRSETQAYVERCMATPQCGPGCVRASPMGSAPSRLRLCAGTPLVGQRLMTEVSNEVTIWAFRQPQH